MIKKSISTVPKQKLCLEAKVSPKQLKFLGDQHTYKAFVAGMGSGKSFVGGFGTCLHHYAHPGVLTGYFAPTYAQIRDIYYPTIEKVAAQLQLRVQIKEGNKEVHFFNSLNQFLGVQKCRSMDDPSNIVGFEIGHAHIDELDVLDAKKARQAWQKIIARLRHQGGKCDIDVTTTPEGFKFTYETFKKNPTASYVLHHGSTYENELNLPPSYIANLIETYPQALIKAYLHGQFVNLTSGTVYYSFKRDTCNSNETIKPNEALYIGQDFNVGHMSSRVCVKRDKTFHLVAELDDIFDTPALIKTLQREYKGHPMAVYPDVAGNNRSTSNASISDIALLKQAGFKIRVRKTHPAIKDRVTAVNNALEKGFLRVNSSTAKRSSEDLEQQAYDKWGMPEKNSAGHDHGNDALGYLIEYELPVVRPVSFVPAQLGTVLSY